MRLRLTLSLSVSIILIGIASWSRFGTANYIQPNTIAIEQFGIGEKYYSDEKFLQDFLEPKATSTEISTEPLSNTDMIGRQLILDYIDLATSGNAGINSIDALAERYVESIPTINKTTSIDHKDILVVSNAKHNLQNYANELIRIHTSYVERVTKAYVGGGSTATLGPSLYSFALIFSTSYADTAIQLQNLPVPTSLVPTHIKLVNGYNSSSIAMKALSEAENDSAAAFAGLIAFNKNIEKEESLLEEISNILTSNGI
jgi:hypothetical protein